MISLIIAIIECVVIVGLCLKLFVLQKQYNKLESVTRYGIDQRIKSGTLFKKKSVDKFEKAHDRILKELENG
jgi:hypothetical protein